MNASARPSVGRTEDLAVRGGKLRLEIAGDGPPVVLLHGWMLDHRMWRPQLLALAARFRLIALDRRGFGQSSAPPGLNEEINDILSVASVLSLPPFFLVGMSQGGRVALRFAEQHPDKLRGLILVGTPLDGLEAAPVPEESIPFDHYARLAREGRVEEVRQAWLAHPLMRVEEPKTARLVEEMVGDYAGRDLLIPREARGKPVDLSRIPVPALVITGEKDSLERRQMGDAIAAGLATSTRASIPGAGHLCSISHPQLFNSLLSEFLETLMHPNIERTDASKAETDHLPGSE